MILTVKLARLVCLWLSDCLLLSLTISTWSLSSPWYRGREVDVQLVDDVLVHVEVVVLLIHKVQVVVILVVVIVVQVVCDVGNSAAKILILSNYSLQWRYLNMETDMERKAIWDKETALESAVDGHCSPPSQTLILFGIWLLFEIHAKNVWCCGEGYFGQKKLRKKCVNRDKM